jgi:hypothetical protein
MLKNAVDVKRNYLEKNYPDIIQKIVSAINEAQERDATSVTIFFTSSEWNSFNYHDVEWYLNSFEYKCKYDSSTVRWEDIGYYITVEWWIE